MKQRESFSSRLGFLLISAGCAIGLGNVWRFPYITGQYGGAAFVVVYLLFLVIMGLPVMVMEFSVGRGSQKSMAGSFQALEPKGTRWHWYSWFSLAGNYLLMMFYTSVSGWLILYCIKMAKGDFHGLDTAGLIIFPACSAFDVAADSGANLIFITLPNVFNSMSGGRLWGALFFVFMSFAALSTVIAVFENIICFYMDKWGWSRKKAVLVNTVAILVLSMPCVLGFNLWSGFQPLGAGTSIMDLEDFLVSDNILPLGSLVYLLFCVTRKGWGWENFLAEANTGSGLRFPRNVRFYVTFLLPIIMFIIFVMGYWNRFFA